MGTPLHDPAALEGLAEAGGPAGDWARLRLALVAPDRARGLPSDPWEAAVCLAVGAAGSRESLLARLRGGRRDPGAVELAEALTLFGLLPEEPEPWQEAARGALRGDGRDTDLLLVALIAELGGLDRDLLATAAASASSRTAFLVPPLVMRFVDRHEPRRAAEVAAEVAASLARQEQARPGMVGLCLARLGVPVIEVEDPEPEAAVRRGAEVAGARSPRLREARGSVRRRARRAALELAEGCTGPAALLLAALARQEEGPEPWELAAAASWLAGYHPGPDPVEDVALRGAGEAPGALAAARRGLRPGHAEVLTRAAGAPLRHLPAAALAAPLLARPSAPEGLVQALADRCLLRAPADPRTGVAGCVALARSPARVRALLEDPGTLDHGLTYARFAAFEEVLEALLELPVPDAPERRALLGRALADQGDRAASERLNRLSASFPEEEPLARAVDRSRILLGGG